MQTQPAFASIVLCLAATAIAGGAVPQVWRTRDDIIDGWDWSLPPGVKPDPSSGVLINERKAGPDFPGRLSRQVNWSWRLLEPEEGRFDFAPLREAILKQSEGGKYAIELHVRASVWELRNFPDEAGYPKGWERHKERSATAPRWLKRYGIPLREMRKRGKDNIGTPFQVVNLDIWHPDYHRRYVRMVRALGRSGVPRMPEATWVFVHLWSSSRGEEGAGPPPGDPKRKLFEERLRAWAEACRGVERKLCVVSHKEADLELATKLGMGQRNGFVEMYMLHCESPMLGQSVDADGYLVVDETCPLIAENRASGDENEEYVPSAHVARFGPVEGWPHRYRESMLRVLQMRRNFVWAEGGRGLMDPPLLCYVALELGKNVRNAPDAWCYLRESVIGRGKRAKPVKNFERWLYQRDRDGCRTVATEKVVVQRQIGHHPAHQYDYTARRTDMAKGQVFIAFSLDDRFLGARAEPVAVKITYRDRGNARWALAYATPKGEQRKMVTCGDTGKVRTATFFLPDARFHAPGLEPDFFIRALEGNAVISFVRVIKLEALRREP